MMKMGPLIRDIEGFVPIEDILTSNFFTAPLSNTASPVKVTRFTVNALPSEADPVPPTASSDCPWEGLGMVDLGFTRSGNSTKQTSERTSSAQRPNIEVINLGFHKNGNTARPDLHSQDNPYINIDGSAKHLSPANFKEIPVIDLRPRHASSASHVANFGPLPNIRAPVHLGTIHLGTQSLPRPVKVKVQQPSINNNLYPVTLALPSEDNSVKESSTISDYSDVIDSYKEKPALTKYTMTLDRPKKVREFSGLKANAERLGSDNVYPQAQNAHVKHHKIKVVDARQHLNQYEPHNNLQKFPVPALETVNVDEAAIESTADEGRISRVTKGVTFKPSILVCHLGEEGLLGTESLPLEEDKNTAGRVKRMTKSKPQEPLMV